MERFKLKKFRFAALEDFDTEMEINSALGND
jgi:hypothetical protein